MNIPDFLCIGFFCHDVSGDGYILGGTASYCSLAASRLGVNTAVVTSVGSDFLFFDTFQKEGIAVCNKPAPKTTVFHNIYKKDIRTQYLYDRAKTIEEGDLPEAWIKTPIVKFCLIADEVAPSLLKAFPNSLKAATIQGWLRQWDNKGKISPKTMDWDLLNTIDIVLFSDADIPNIEEVLPILTNKVEVVVMTRGANGASIFYIEKQYDFPAYPVQEVDPTGAGDVFAAAFIVEYSKQENIALAAAYAHTVASFIVEQEGAQFPTIEAIEDRLLAYQKLFPETQNLL